MTTTPLTQGYLETADGHRVKYAQFGAPDGAAAVVLHGGPGSSSQLNMLDWFDLSRQRVLLLDQRGCGKSLPTGSLEHNTTPHLIEDIERLRVHLGIKSWVVVGGSWGAFLALAYAAAKPAAVRKLVLRGVFLPTEQQLDWFFQRLRLLMPLAWRELTFDMTARQADSVLHTLGLALLEGNEHRQAWAAGRWATYENRIMAAMAGQPLTDATVSADTARIHKYRIQAHYLLNHCFSDVPTVLRALRKTGIGVVCVHGAHDWICPPANVALLSEALTDVDVRWVPRGTHTTADPSIRDALTLALRDVFQTLPRSGL